MKYIFCESNHLGVEFLGLEIYERSGKSVVQLPSIGYMKEV